MTKHFKFSKGFHLATLCCFLLPFFYTGCGPSAEEMAVREKAMQDSIATVAKYADTSYKENQDAQSYILSEQKNISECDTLNHQASNLQPETTSITEPESKIPSEAISNEYELLRPILVPKDNTYTGIASVIDGIPYILFYSVFICFFLLILSLASKFIDSNSKRTVVLLEVSALIFLLVSYPYSLFAEKLWGFWVTVAFISVLTVYDFYITRLAEVPKE